MSPHDHGLADPLPPSLRYMRQCFRIFAEHKPRQILLSWSPGNDRHKLVWDEDVLTEPLWHNSRLNFVFKGTTANGYPYPSRSRAWVEEKWQRLLVNPIHDLLDVKTGRPFTILEWEEFLYELADPGIKDTGSYYIWRDARVVE